MPSLYDILYSDGEGAEFGDFNNSQRAIMSPIWRAFSDIGRNSTGTESWSNNPTSFLAVLGAGDAQPVPNTSLALGIKLTDGMIMQRMSNTFDPADSNVLGYFVDAPGDAGTAFTHAAADPTLPRWDLVVASLARGAGGLENRDFKDATTGALTSVSLSKRRNVQLTTQLIAGTPNASPAIPAVPGGTLPLYAVLVPAAYNAVFTQDQIIDYRMPLGLTVLDVYAADMWRRGSFLETGGSIALDAERAFPQITVPAAGCQVAFLPPLLGSGARLLSVGALMSPNGVTGSHQIERFRSNNNAVLFGTLVNSLGTSLLSAVSSVNTSTFKRADTTALPNSTLGGVTTPIWSSGYASPLEQGNNAFMNRVGVRWTSGTAADSHCLMRFVFAGTF